MVGRLVSFWDGPFSGEGNSHHQDYSIFSRESQLKPSFVTGILGGGGRPNLTPFFFRIFDERTPQSETNVE